MTDIHQPLRDLRGDDSMFSNVRNGDVRALLANLDAAVEALTELVESHLAQFPPFEAGLHAQDAWARRREKAIRDAVATLSQIKAGRQA